MGFLGINFKLPSIPLWFRDKTGNSFYDITDFDNWTKDTSNMYLAQNHPLLSPAILFIAKLFSQAEIEITRSSTKKLYENHPMASLFIKPNYTQTFSDFLEALLFTQIANGVGVVWKKKTLGVSRINSLYVLDFSLMKFPDSIQKGKYINANSEKYKGVRVKYDELNENLDIPLSELIFFYDMPNGMNSKNVFEVSSRLEGLKQTLYNTKDSLIAKNIIIKSNGKEMITGTKDGFPLSSDDKERLEREYNDSYGMTRFRRRGFVTKSSLKWQSLHIIMRDLGADEGIRTDANIVFTGLHLPSDVYSIENAKSTYKNANQSLVSYIQNEIQSILKSTLDTLNADLFKDGVYKLTGHYNHLPVMLAYETIKYEGLSARAKALSDLRKSGIPDELALELCDFDKGLQLGDLIEIQTSPNSEDNITQEQEDKLIELIETYG